MSIHLLLRELHSRSTDDLVDSTLHPSNETTADPLDDKRSWLRGVVAAVSLLSMIGAALIVLSYICISSIRTKSREILVHLSVADFGVGCANFIGIIVNFDHRIETCQYHNHASCDDLKHLCTAQAFFAGFSTLASILWTLALSVYIYLLVVHGHRKLHSKIVYFFYVFCWGMPLLISLWLVFTGRLGHTPHGGSGWCSLIIEQEERSTAILITILGNDLWVYLTVVVVTVLYLTTHCHIKRNLQASIVQSNPRSSAVASADTKFLLIPLAFMLLRIGSIAVTIVFIYAEATPGEKISYFLLCVAGIGDSGQGFVNALLFCLFTTKVREKFKTEVMRLYHCCRCRRHPYTNLDYSTNASLPDSQAKRKKLPLSENA